MRHSRAVRPPLARSAPRALVAASLLCAAAASSALPAQVTPGHIVVLHATAQSAEIVLVEPIHGTPTTSTLPSGIQWRLAVWHENGDRLLLAGNDAAGERIFAATVTSGRVDPPVAISSPLPGRVVAMTHADAGWLVATSGGLVLLPTWSAVPQLLDATPIAAATRGANEFATVTETSSSTGTLRTFATVDLRTLQRRSVRIDVQVAGLAWSLSESYVAAETQGRLFALSPVTGAARLLTTVAAAPVGSIVHDPYRRRYLVGVPGALVLSTLSGPVGSVLLPGGLETRSLELVPYAATARSYGAACASGGPTVGAVGAPFPGNSAFALTGIPTPPGAPAVLFVGAQPTAIDLTGIGMPGCRLLTTPIATLSTVAGPTGRLLLPFPVPPLPPLVGQVVHVQWAVVDPTANALGIATSDGLRLGF